MQRGTVWSKTLHITYADFLLVDKHFHYFYDDVEFNTVDTASILGLGRSVVEGKGNPLQYSCLENSIDSGAWWATVHGVSKNWTQLSTHTCSALAWPGLLSCPFPKPSTLSFPKVGWCYLPWKLQTLAGLQPAAIHQTCWLGIWKGGAFLTQWLTMASISHTFCFKIPIKCQQGV